MAEKLKTAIMAGCVLAILAGNVQAAGLVPYQDAERVMAGEKIYDEACASCHGADLEGEPDWRTPDGEGYLPAPPHDETGHTWHHPDRMLFMITKYGTERVAGNGYRSRMLGFEDSLTDQDILDVLAYIKSTWPVAVKKRHDAINARAD